MNRNLLLQILSCKRNMNLSRDQILELQDKKLRRLLSFAWDHSPYYRRVFQEAGIGKKDLSRLPLSAFPVMDKGILMEHFDEIVTVPGITQKELREYDESSGDKRQLFGGKYHIVHSSGSTGIPRYFLYDEDAWSAMLSGVVRAALWDLTVPEMIRLIGSHPRILYIAATDGRYGGAMAVADGIAGVGAAQLHLDINTPLDLWIEKVRDFKPDIVIGYPSAVRILGGLAEEGEVTLHVSRVISCGEPLSLSLRRYFEKTFQAKVLNFYGASESLALGVEENPQEGMLLFDDLNVIQAERGNLYLTSLYNFSQPLIRYRLNDTVTLESDDGRHPFTRARGLIGRDEDLLWFEDGKHRRDFLHPLAIEGLCIQGLHSYQFCQSGRDRFTIYAELSGLADPGAVKNQLIRQVDEILREKRLEYVSYGVEFVHQILPNPRTGKKDLVLIGERRKPA